MKQTPSPETQNNAQAMAKATQKPGQTKEQTKLIAAGIEKGIAEYKKREKAKSRERDKARKQRLKAKNNDYESDEVDSLNEESYSQMTSLTWVLLGLLLLSWAGFAAYFLML
ncbi:DUF2956 domain-containing protein [Shewanella ulleungensis]|jgi:hypothetical protein|uniref:Membrane protein n=1 Tax=Shewanella ulleungensis TaxID=2282699 RepID=A0ABQ2QR61_9GAMM|nr:DUF2956 domain-containing protein [Shewanella ulleungensis]MCL1150781.1 DUF2956 domain-containing protein [Shewanella ulleungensis]GGP93579.1 membrane protein [Shewanella ulleungensis]